MVRTLSFFCDLNVAGGTPLSRDQGHVMKIFESIAEFINPVVLSEYSLNSADMVLSSALSSESVGRTGFNFSLKERIAFSIALGATVETNRTESFEISPPKSRA